MCTVSFVNSKGKIIITSNRDEKVAREKAIEPKIEVVNHKKIFFPKDQKAGGTWFAVDENANVVVLLNGAKDIHEIKPSYKKSRGLIVLELIGSESIIESWHQINLENIEPFTLIVFSNNELYQLRWNELEKETINLSIFKNYIWSSSTLYSSEIRNEREQWFSDFLTSKEKVSAIDVFNFHYNPENNNQQSVLINRYDILKTLSISQTIIENKNVLLHYHDLIENKNFSNSFNSK